VSYAGEPVFIQALIPEESVEALDERVLRGFSGRNNLSWTPC